MTSRRLTESEILSQIPPARTRAAAARKAGLRAANARYDRGDRRIVVELTNGFVIAFPPKVVRGLARATPAQLELVEVSPSGAGLHWDAVDADLSIPGLLISAFGQGAFMGEVGRAGGQVSSEAKATAARANGAKGGRPRKRSTAGAR
jgi:hypothetical protein